VSDLNSTTIGLSLERERLKGGKGPSFQIGKMGKTAAKPIFFRGEKEEEEQGGKRIYSSLFQ